MFSRNSWSCHYHKIRYKISSPRILGRVSCFGTRIIHGLGVKHFLNNQKFRTIDILNSQSSYPFRPPPKQVSIFNDDTLFGLVRAQATLHLTSPSLNPDIIIIESYSDLTDILFEYDSKYSFLCHVSDLKPTVWKTLSLPNSSFSRLNNFGLCDLKDFSTHLLSLIRLLSFIHGSHTPIFFINTPVDFDRRPKLHNRFEAISSASSLVSHQFSNFHHLAIPPSFVEPLSESSLPYHFSDKTVNYCVDFINSAQSDL